MGKTHRKTILKALSGITGLWQVNGKNELSLKSVGSTG